MVQNTPLILDAHQINQSLETSLSNWKIIKSTTTPEIWQKALSFYNDVVYNSSDVYAHWSACEDEFLIEVLQSLILLEDKVDDFMRHNVRIIDKLSDNILKQTLLQSLLNYYDIDWINDKKLKPDSILRMYKIAIDNFDEFFKKSERPWNIYNTIIKDKKFNDKTVLWSKIHEQIKTIDKLYDIPNRDSLFDNIPDGHPILDTIIAKDNLIDVRSRTSNLSGYIEKLNKDQFEIVAKIVDGGSSAVQKSILIRSKHCYGRYLKHALVCLARLTGIDKSTGNSTINVALKNSDFLELNDGDKFVLFKKMFVAEYDRKTFTKITFDKVFDFDAIQQLMIPAIISGAADKEKVNYILKHLDQFRSKNEIGKTYMTCFISLIVLREVNISKINTTDIGEMILTHSVILDVIRNKPSIVYMFIRDELTEFIYDCNGHIDGAYIDIIKWSEKRCKTIVKILEGLNLPIRNRRMKIVNNNYE